VAAALVVPIGAFFLRLYSGGKRIDGNHCSVLMRRVQSIVFMLGIFSLLLADAWLITIHAVIPNAQLEALVICSPLLLIYLLAMVVAMYPGRDSEQENGDLAGDGNAAW